MKAPMPITWFETIDSTNSEARRQLDNVDKMAAFAARFQTAGRGQRGNRWSSASGENLTFSILAKPSCGGIPAVTARDQFDISVVSALAVSDLLLSYGIENRIKWPNDIYIKDRKVCGMLIENILGAGDVAASIIGIGLNLNQTEFPPELVNPTSVILASGQRHDPEEVLEDFLGIFQEMFSRLSDTEDVAALRNKYVSRMYRLGKTHEYYDCTGESPFMGKIKGISGEGMLLMEMPDESIRTFAFKEISYII